jgi:hypothetical protein
MRSGRIQHQKAIKNAGIPTTFATAYRARGWGLLMACRMASEVTVGGLALSICFCFDRHTGGDEVWSLG